MADDPDGPARSEVRLTASPQAVRTALPPGMRDVDLWLRARTADGLPVLLQRAELVREATGADRALAWLPLACALAVFLLVVRPLGTPLAFLFAGLALATTALAVIVIHDPVALLQVRPGVRERLQVLGVAALAAGALWLEPSRRLSLATVALACALVYLPTVNGGLSGDDFARARPWTVREVASTFVGPDDPTGVSNTYYRPVVSSTHAADFLVWGDFIPGLHLTNVVLAAVSGAAALLLLERLGLSRRAALAGALAWTAHPMAASAVAWISERTDLLGSAFYLASLAVLVSPAGRRGWPPLLPAALALGSKETVVSLPAMAALVVVLALPAEERRRRVPALLALVLLTVCYVTWWIHLFPEKAGLRAFGAGDVPGGGRPGAVGRALLDVVASVVWPVGYEEWWRGRLSGWGPVAFAGALLAVPLLAAALLACRRCAPRPAFAAVALAAAWPLVAAIPLFGIGLVDPYRLGRFPSFAIALAAGGLAHHLEHGGARRVLPLAVILIAWLAPLGIATARAWGPSGFYYEQQLGLTAADPGWVPHFAPRPRERFFEEVARSEHDREAAERVRKRASPRP